VIAPFEDGPPCVAPRLVVPKPYLVTYGLGSGERDFATWADASEFYRSATKLKGGARVFNLDRCDFCSDRGENDGLTTAQREDLEAIDEQTTITVTL
jgi:hypothetical protein